MAAAAGTGLTTIIASHVVSELERLCDWLIVLTGGHVQLAGPADDLLAAHRLLTVPRATPDAELPGLPIHRADSDRHSTVVVRTDPPGRRRRSTPDGRPTRWASNSSSWPICNGPPQRRPQVIPPRPRCGPGRPARR